MAAGYVAPDRRNLCRCGAPLVNATCQLVAYMSTCGRNDKCVVQLSWAAVSVNARTPQRRGFLKNVDDRSAVGQERSVLIRSGLWSEAVKNEQPSRATVFRLPDPRRRSGMRSTPAPP